MLRSSRLTRRPASERNSPGGTPSLRADLALGRLQHLLAGPRDPARDRRLVDAVDVGQLLVRQAAHDGQLEQQAIAIGQRRPARRAPPPRTPPCSGSAGSRSPGVRWRGGPRRPRGSRPVVRAADRRRSSATRWAATATQPASGPRPAYDWMRGALPGRPHEDPLPEDLADLVAQIGAAVDARDRGGDRAGAEPIAVGERVRHALGAGHRERQVLDVEIGEARLDVVAGRPRDGLDEASRIDRQIGPGLRDRAR